MTDIQAAIRAVDDDFEAAFETGNAAEIAELYTDDGMLLPAGSDVVQGKKGIAAFWQGAMDMGIKHATLEITEIEQHGDTAIDVGRYTLSGSVGQVIDQGKYVVIWKHEDGTWKLHRDIWNSSLAQ